MDSTATARFIVLTVAQPVWCILLRLSLLGNSDQCTFTELDYKSSWVYSVKVINHTRKSEFTVHKFHVNNQFESIEELKHQVG